MTTIRTERLVLRRARPDDLDGLHAVLSNPKATAYWSTPPHATVEQTRDWLDGMMSSPPELAEDFVIERDGRVLGKVGFYRLPEIGYILAPEAWGQGLAFEAARAVIDHVFATRDLDPLTADVDPRNNASIRLLERLGFRPNGAAERTFEIGGVWVDSLYYRLARSDWVKAEPSA